MDNGHHPGNDFASKIMSKIWDEFSPMTGRENHHKFLLEILNLYFKDNKNKKILDSCLGTAIDAIPILQDGYKVIGNEVDENFRNKSLEKIKKLNLEMEVMDYDWLKLDKYPDKVDAVLCVGNSFCWLFGKENQKKAIQNFYNILNKDGLLIIDERNIQYMMDHRDEILENSKKTIANHAGLNGKTLYGGKEYFPFPVRITDTEVEMGKFKVGETEPFTSTFFYPFKKGELKSLLDNVFSTQNVTTYSDYQLGFNPEAGFYQYVCKKSD